MKLSPFSMVWIFRFISSENDVWINLLRKFFQILTFQTNFPIFALIIQAMEKFEYSATVNEITLKCFRSWFSIFLKLFDIINKKKYIHKQYIIIVVKINFYLKYEAIVFMFFL